MKHTAVCIWVSIVIAVGIYGSACQDTTPSDKKAEATSLSPGIHFVDISEQVGLSFVHINGSSGRRYFPETMVAGGCSFDFDADGWLDLYLVQSGALPGYHGRMDVNHLFRNTGMGTFEDVTDASGTGHPGYGAGAIAADYDGDADLDLYITNFGPNVLLQNNGNGTFTEVTNQAGVGDPSWSASAAFFDAEGDGDLDLYVVNYLHFTIANHKRCGREGHASYCHPDAYPPAPDVFYRNNGDGTFTDMTKVSGLTAPGGKGLGIVVADFDNDAKPDLYIANDSTPNFLYHNLGDGKFEEVGLFQAATYNEEGKTEAGMGVDAGDVNRDGFFDIFVTNLSLEANALYLGGAHAFTYATRKAGLYAPSYPVLGFGTDLLDIDNDADLDLFVVNGDVLDNVDTFNDSLRWRQKGQIFLNDGTGQFSELASDRIPDIAVPRVGRGSATTDFDNDGRLDVLVSYNNDQARLYHNQTSAGNWIGFQLTGTGMNTGAVGARVTVEIGEQHQMDEVKVGSSYLGSSDPRLHFGLGTAKRVDQVSVRWPWAATEVFHNLEAGQYYHITQGQGIVTPQEETRPDK